jgi:hypothetical protein
MLFGRHPLDWVLRKRKRMMAYSMLVCALMRLKVLSMVELKQILETMQKSIFVY